MNPINEKERIASIDILRGFAILGIFFVNMPSFFSPFLYLNPEIYWKSNSDQFLNKLVDIFAQASFYPLFAFLFGYGAILLAERLTIKELSFKLYFTRRLLVLLIFGAVHAFFVWHGDILITYAISGLVFMLFYKCKGRTLLLTGIISYCVFFGLLSSAMLLVDQTGMTNYMFDPEAVKQSVQNYSSGSYGELFSQRFEDWYLVNGPAAMWLLIINIVPFMMVGAAFAKKKWLVEVQKNRKLLISLICFSLIGGLILKSLPYLPALERIPSTSQFLQDQFGGPLLSLFYITGLIVLLENKRLFSIMKPLSYVGRLSISNYLFQSILCTTLFYSYGFGLYGSVPFSFGFGLVIVIFVIQVIVSKWWIAKYKFGPVEFLWRWGTYGSKPKMRKMEREKLYEIGNS